MKTDLAHLGAHLKSIRRFMAKLRSQRDTANNRVEAQLEECERLWELLRHIRYQANDRLEDGHGYRGALVVTVIEIDALRGELGR